MTICMRVAPSGDQVLADSINWSEQLRSKSIAGSDDVMTVVQKIGKMQAFADTKKGDVSAGVAVKQCADWGLRWQGKSIEKQTWLAIQAVMPFCQDDEILSAIGDIKTLYADIDQMTKLSKLCKIALSFIKGSFLNDEFQEKGAAALALQWALQWFYHSLQFADVEKAQVNNNFLVGARQTEVGTIQVYFRKLQTLDFVWRHYRSSPAFLPDVGKLLWDKFSSLSVFVSWAAADEFSKKDAEAVVFVNGQKGISHWTTLKFQEFCQKLPNHTAVAFAELLFGIMTTDFDMQFLDHVTEYPDGGHADYDSLAQMLRGSGDETPLTTAFKKYTKALGSQAVSIDDVGSAGLSQPSAAFSQPLAALDASLVGDDADLAAQHLEKKQLCDKVVADRQGKVRFHGLPNLPNGPLGNFCAASELNKLMADCPFHAATQVGPQGKAPARAFLLSADLFPGCMASGLKDFRLPAKFFQEMEVPAALKALWSWVLSVRRPNDSIIVFDGRFANVRRFFDTELAKLGQNNVMDMWVIYDMPQEDPRYPRRQLAFSNCNRETILVYHPVHKNSKTRNLRQSFNVCGEKSTFDMTYSGVRLRGIEELPKITTADKKKMMGSDLTIPLAYGEEDQSLAVDGVPFAWAESKPVEFWAGFFKDLQLDHIFDTTAGSGAAAIGAFYDGLQYDGICGNSLHKAWCEQVMNQAMFAVVADGGAGATPPYVAKVMQFFGASVDAGMRMIRAPKSAGKVRGPEASKPETAPEEESDGDGFD